MKPRDFSITPNKITELSRREVFVFGSNLQGHHGGGAARTAMDKFGAQWGVGVGPTGQCYAIPTMQGGVETIEPYVDQFLEYAKNNPDTRFLVTRIGCGIAGFDDMQIAPLFEKAVNLPNVALPRVWWNIIGEECRTYRKEKAWGTYPPAWTMELLERFCREHTYEIASGIKDFLPKRRIRYIRGRGEFGYATLGDFFFLEGGTDTLYVWETDDKYAEDHNQDLVEEILNDECVGRGYACRMLYAGVQTDFKDVNGDYIYTGDVIEVSGSDNCEKMQLAVGVFGDAEEGAYRFILDNHSWLLKDCIQSGATLKRIGTVFYQMDINEDSEEVNRRVMDFNVSYEPKEDREVRVLMAKYTPNFDQERWKYQGLEILGCEEFDWRK